MPVTVQWVDEAQSILLYRFIQNWTWEDMYEIFDQTNELIAQSPAPQIVSIFDLTQSGFIPKGALLHLQKLTRLENERTTFTPVVGTSPFIKHLFSLYMNLYGTLRKGVKRVRVDTLSEAYEQIALYREQTPTSEPVSWQS